MLRIAAFNIIATWLDIILHGNDETVNDISHHRQTYLID